MANIIEQVRDYFNNREIKSRLETIKHVYEKRINEIEEASDASTKQYNGSPVSSKLTKFFKIIKRKLGFGNYYPNPYDFKALRGAYENEGYVRRAVDHYTESVMRNGYTIVGETEDNVLYIKRRLSEFQMVSGISMDTVVRDIVSQLLLYGNCIASLSRSLNASSGEQYTRFDGKDMNPISAIYVEDSRSIKIKNDERYGLIYQRIYDKDYSSGNNPTITEQSSYNNPTLGGGYSGFISYGRYANDAAKESTITRENIYHLGFHRQPGDIWAAPPYASVLDDIRTLRSIEENVELLVFQYGHGILHGKVGDDKKSGTNDEILNLKYQIQDMEANGFLVTDNRVDLTIKGVEGSAIDVSKYLEYFKARVFSGLYMSGVGMGEGSTSNRNTASVMSKDKVDRTVEIQRYISELYSKLFKELLLERGLDYKDIHRKDNRVELVFPEVDIDAKIKMEEHYLNMFVQNGITIDELREKLGFGDLSEEMEERMFNKFVTAQKTEHEGQIQMDIAQQKQTTAITTSKTTSSSKTTGAINRANQKKQPVNQYGKKTTTSPRKD